MDWLDAYLDNLADGRNVVYPPDKNTWTPVKPNRQQQSMIQDAVAFDQQQQMRMIQEARADLEAHGMSNADVEAGIGADPGSPTVQTLDTGTWLTRKVYTEFLGGYGVPNPTYTELSDAIAAWTPVLIDRPTSYVWADLPLGTWEFTGYFVAPEAGLYSFSSSVDDYTFISFGAPVSINNVGYITLQAGEAVPLRILAANVSGPGNLSLLWKNNASQTSYTSNFDGLVYTTLPAGTPIVDPVIPPDALQLWLKADAGITKFSYNYPAQIIITGTSTPDVSGTYVATTIPTWNFDDNQLDAFQLAGPGGKTINWDVNEGYLILDGSFTSSNGASWNVLPPSQIFITGFTGTYAGANGSYDLNEGTNWIGPNGFEIQDNSLVAGNEGFVVIATAPAGYIGAWTATSYDSSVTISGAGTSSANATYTRADTQINMFSVSFTASEGRFIYRSGSAWIISVGTGGDDYENPYGDLINWTVQDGIAPAPSGSVGQSARSVGSPTSTVIPTGTITGSVSTVIVNTQKLSEWADQSGNNRNAGPDSADRPSFVTIGGTQAFVSFPVNANMSIYPGVLASYTGTIFVVSRFPPSADNAGVSLVSQEETFGLARDSSGMLQVSNGNPVYSNMQVNSNTNYILETTLYNNYGTAPGVANLYINGMATGSGPIGDGVAGANTFIGGETSQSSFIAEMIVYNRVLSTAERQQVETYLAQKYAITLIVPNCTDAEASVTMTGWSVGDRTLAPLDPPYAPYGNQTYEYGGEVVRYETGVWIYSNVDVGEIVRAYSYEPWPWLVTWPQGYTASKTCPPL